MENENPLSAGQAAFMNFLVNEKIGQYRETLKSSYIDGIKAEIDECLSILHPPVAPTEEELQHEEMIKQVMPDYKGKDWSVGSIIAKPGNNADGTRRMRMGMSADYVGLHLLYGYLAHKSSDTVDAEMLEFLGNNEALLKQFKKADRFDNACINLIWETANEYLPEQFRPDEKNKADFDDAANNRAFVKSILAEDAVGEWQVEDKLRKIQTAIREIATKDFGLKSHIKGN